MIKKIKTLSLNTTEKEFNQKFSKRLRINENVNTKIEKEVNKIINNIKGINRVVYDITSKPPSTIELE